MKIAFVIYSFPRITESWFLEQVISLTKLGAEVTIFSFEKGNNVKDFPELVEYKILDRTHYGYAPKRAWRRYLLTPIAFLKLLTAHPIVAVRSLRLFISAGYKEYSKYVFWLLLFAPELHKFDVVHCHFGRTANRLLLLRDSLGLTQPLFTTIYGQDAGKYVQAKGRGVYNQLRDSCSKLLTMTDDMTNFFVNLGFSREKVKTHYTAVRVEDYKARIVSVNSEELVHFVFVGRFVDKKGLPDLLEAFAYVHQCMANVHLHIFGDGPNRDAVEALIKCLGITDVITLYGLTPHHKVLEAFAKMHVLVQPSKRAPNGDTDDLPFVLLEAQACGLPVISTYHVGIPEGVWIDHSGLLVNEGDVVGLASAMSSLVQHPELLRNMSIDARTFIEKKFNLSVLSQDLLSLYQTSLVNKS